MTHTNGDLCPCNSNKRFARCCRQTNQRLAELRALIDGDEPIGAEHLGARVAALADPLWRAGRDSELAALLDRIEERRPDAAESLYELTQCLRVQSAMLYAPTEVAPLLEALASSLCTVAPIVLELVDRLSWHGYQAELERLFRACLCQLAASSPVSGPMPDLAASYLSERALNLVVDGCLAADPSLARGELALFAAARGVSNSRAVAVLELAMSKQGKRHATLRAADYRFDAGTPEELAERLGTLIDHFGFTLYTERGWSAPRAWLAYSDLKSRLLEQLGFGLIGAVRIPLAEMCPICAMQAVEAHGAHSPPKPRSGSLVVPALTTFFDNWQLATMIPGAPYRLAALLEALPEWLRFVETRGLLDAREADRLMSIVRAGTQKHAPSLATFQHDPVLATFVAALAKDSAKAKPKAQENPAGPATSKRSPKGSSVAATP